jgi:formate dehydrogenase maturation protein FdhE
VVATAAATLIWIKRISADFVEVVTMTSSSPARPPIRHCPLCGIAMQASRSHENAAGFDIFQCQTCHTTIRQTRTQADDTSNR